MIRRMPDISDGFVNALNIAREGADLAAEWFRSGSAEVESKQDGSPVTVADRSVEELIRNELDKAYPEDGIEGEEFGIKRSRSGGRWIVDPIDGTRSFVHNVPLFSTLLAYVTEGGRVEFGSISAPCAGIDVYAEKGRGCFAQGHPVHVSTVSRIADSYVMATWLEDWRSSQISAILETGARVHSWGDGFGYALVATGHVDAIVDFHVQPYDVAPMSVIVPEAGGSFTSVDGRSGFVHGTGLATNSRIHDTMVKLLNEER